MSCLQARRPAIFEPFRCVGLGELHTISACWEYPNGCVISEVGKPLDFILEVASESTGVRDYAVKRRIYENMKAPESGRFDPSGGRYRDAPPAGDVLINGECRAIPIDARGDGTLWGYSEALGLHPVWQTGNLRFFDPAIGEFLRNPVESEWRLAESEERLARERDARIRSDRRAVRADQEAAAEHYARIASDRRAAYAEAEAARLRRLLSDSE